MLFALPKQATIYGFPFPNSASFHYLWYDLLSEQALLPSYDHCCNSRTQGRSCKALCGTLPHYLVLVWRCEWVMLPSPSDFLRLAGHCSQRRRSAGPSLQDSSSFHSFWRQGTERGAGKRNRCKSIPDY